MIAGASSIMFEEALLLSFMLLSFVFLPSLHTFTHFTLRHIILNSEHTGKNTS